MTEPPIPPNTSSDTSPVGQVVDRKYRVLRKVAEGGMASVYEAQDIHSGKTVALKLMHSVLAQGPQREKFIERFHREARSAAAVHNIHVVSVHDTGEFRGRSYLVMDFVHGTTLRDEMNKHGRYSALETAKIIVEVLDGLAAAHNVNVIHRDIKPENIMISDRGRVQITDFGLAKATSQETLSTTGMLLGTASYLAPEMIENNISGPQTDLYAVGMMAWEMMCGTTPFAADNPVTVVFKHVHEEVPELHSIDSSIAPTFSNFIARLTRRDMNERPNNAADALTQFNAIMQSLTAQELNACVSENADLTGRGGNNVFSSTRTMRSSNSATAPVVRASRSSQFSAQTLDTQRAHANPQDRANSNTARLRKTLHWTHTTTIITVVVALILAILGAATWWITRGPGSYYTLPSATDISCTNESKSCTLTNASWKAYKSTLEVSSIPYTVTHQYSDSVAKGKIVSTTPRTVGSHISKHDGKLRIVVSLGVQKAVIPKNILNYSTSQGKHPLTALEKAGFTNIYHDTKNDEYSLTVPENSLISISPSPGTKMKHNQRVTIALSKGYQPVAMPSIVGLSKAKAAKMLKLAYLDVTYVEKYSSTVAKGKVISASEEAGAQLHWKDKVQVVISKGPKTITMPDVTGMTLTEAKNKLTKLGFEVKIDRGNKTGSKVASQSIEAGTQVSVVTSDSQARVVTLVPTNKTLFSD